MRDVLIVDAVRSPIGKRNRSLAWASQFEGAERIAERYGITRASDELGTLVERLW